MKQQELTLYQVIAILNQLETKDKVFKRVGDEKFKIFRGNYGDLMFKVNDMIRPLPIFNYLHDRFVEDDNNE